MPVCFKRAKAYPSFEERAITVDEGWEEGCKKDDWVVEEPLFLLPTFANVHTHGAMYGLKNSGEGLRLLEWLEKLIWPAEKKLRREDFYHFTRLSAIEMVRGGIEGIADMYIGHVEEIKRAYEEIGLAGLVHYAVIGEDWEGQLREAKKKAATQGSVKVGIGAHAIYSTPLEGIKTAYEENKRLGLPFHIHVSETREEVFYALKTFGKRPVEVLYEAGVMEGSLLAHASWVTKREIGLVKKSKAWPIHCPKSNQKLATGGIAPIEEYGRFALGTDGPASNNRLDFWEEMRMAGYLQKLRYWDATKGSPGTLLKAALEWGWEALGIKPTGVIAVSGMCPCPNPKEALVYNTGVEHVRWVVMGGEVKVESGSLTPLLRKKWEESYSYALKRAEELWEYG